MQRSNTFFIGTYTEELYASKETKSEGIYALTLKRESGKVESLVLAATMENPSYLTYHKTQKILYAVSEQLVGEVYAYQIKDNETLKYKEQIRTEGANPCHLAINPTGENLLVSNYSGGNLALIALEEAGDFAGNPYIRTHVGGSCNPFRQEGPHPHMALFTPDGTHACVADLGMNAIVLYRTVENKLTPMDMVHAAPGAGPRHLAWGEANQTLYCLNELNGTIDAYAYQKEMAALSHLATTRVIAEEETANTTMAAVRISQNGKYLYCTSRGLDQIHVFQIKGEGKLCRVQDISSGGKTPRDLWLTQDGAWALAANQESDTVSVFSIAQETGRLSLKQKIDVPAPTCILEWEEVPYGV